MTEEVVLLFRPLRLELKLGLTLFNLKRKRIQGSCYFGFHYFDGDVFCQGGKKGANVALPHTHYNPRSNRCKGQREVGVSKSHGHSKPFKNSLNLKGHWAQMGALKVFFPTCLPTLLL